MYLAVFFSELVLYCGVLGCLLDYFVSSGTSTSPMIMWATQYATVLPNPTSVNFKCV